MEGLIITIILFIVCPLLTVLGIWCYYKKKSIVNDEIIERQTETIKRLEDTADMYRNGYTNLCINITKDRDF